MTTGVTRYEVFHSKTSVFETFIYDLQQHPLLRIHGFGVAWSNIEKGSIKRRDILFDKMRAIWYYGTYFVCLVLK